MSEETGSNSTKDETVKKAAPKRRTTKKPASTAKKTATAQKATPKKATTKAAQAKTAARKASASKPATRKTAAAKSASTSKTKKAAATPKAEAVEEPIAPPPAQQEEKTGDAQMNGDTDSARAQNSTSQLVEDLKGRDWPQILKRALLMLFFGVLGSAALYVAFFLAATQVVFTIFAGETNPSLTRLIKQLGNYIHDVLDYLSFASEECPFPFGRSWPDAD